MPERARRLCSYPGCHAFTVKDGRCEAHQYEKFRRYDQRPDWHRWYSSPAWLALREHQLKLEPFCRTCSRAGRITVAEVVDHIEPHGGRWEDFMDRDNLQSLCKRCHDRKTASEDGGFGNRRRSGG